MSGAHSGRLWQRQKQRSVPVFCSGRPPRQRTSCSEQLSKHDEANQPCRCFLPVSPPHRSTAQFPFTLEAQCHFQVVNLVRQWAELPDHIHRLPLNPAVPLKQTCWCCRASPDGCSDGLLGYLSREWSSWDLRPRKQKKDKTLNGRKIWEMELTSSDGDKDKSNKLWGRRSKQRSSNLLHLSKCLLF